MDKVQKKNNTFTDYNVPSSEPFKDQLVNDVSENSLCLQWG
jgi:hypothetical protein